MERERSFEVLRVVFVELHSSIRALEALEHKVAFGLSTGLLAVAAFLMRGGYKPERPQLAVAIFLIVVLVGFGAGFLLRNSRLIKMNCRMIVRIEQIFGLYEVGKYIQPEQVEMLEYIPFGEASVFPPEVMLWGMDNRWQSVTGHTAMVVLSGVGAVAALLVA